MPLQPRVTEVEKLLFCSDVAAIGAFRCPATHRVYKDSEPMSGNTLVFPRSSTTIVTEGARAITAAPPTILFYNFRQEYVRRKIDDIDSCDWFMLAPDIARDIVSRYDAAASDRVRVFKIFAGPSSEQVYLAQRQLVSRLMKGDAIEPLEIEERAVAIADAAVSDAISSARRVRTNSDAVERVKSAIAARPDRNQSLRVLAAAAECSPFELCRSFRSVTGSTITAYRHALRLRRALDLLGDTPHDVTRIALDLGYASHSHFTKFFHRHFGLTPSAFRART